MIYKSVLYQLLTASIVVTSLATKQRPILNPIALPAMPPTEDSPSTSTPANDDTVILSDVLGRDRSINIFAGFTRDFANISSRFEDSSKNTTILAPVNSAIMGLPRKPWEDPKDYANLGAEAYEGNDGEERAKDNMRRFVEAHVVGVSPWKEGEKVETLDGGKVWWEMKEGKRMVSDSLTR